MSPEYITLIPPEPPERYFRGPLPDPYDSHLTEYVRAFRDLSAERRDEVIGTLTQPERVVLKDFSERAAALAVRSRSLALIDDGVTALAITDFVDDLNNDSLLDNKSLAVLRDAANRIGVDFNDILDRIATFGSSRGAGRISGFKQNLATLEEMSYMCIDEPDGVRYLPNISGLPVGVTLRDFRINEVLKYGNDRTKGGLSQWSRTAHHCVSDQVLRLFPYDVFQAVVSINIMALWAFVWVKVQLAQME